MKNFSGYLVAGNWCQRVKTSQSPKFAKIELHSRLRTSKSYFFGPVSYKAAFSLPHTTIGRSVSVNGMLSKCMLTLPSLYTVTSVADLFLPV